MNCCATRILAALGAILTVGAGSAFGQQTWWVDVHGETPGTGTAADPYTSIHYAVHQSTTMDGDVILVLPGRYEEGVEIVQKYVTVRSTEGPGQTTIDVEGKGSAVVVIGNLGEDTGNVVLEGFTIQGGTGTWIDDQRTGGGILAQDIELSVRHCVIQENRAWRGAGLAALVSYVDMVDCKVEYNFAETELGARDGLGGGIYTDTTGGVTIDDVLVRGNTAGVGGGIYATNANLRVTDSRILANVASGESYDGRAAEGGGVYATASDVRIVESRVDENLASGPGALGGGLRFCNESEVRLEVTEIANNAVGAWRKASRDWPAWGGGIASDVGLTAVGLEVYGNHATGGGGGIYGSGVYSDCRIMGNSAPLGGGVRVEDDADCFFGLVTIVDSVIAENEAIAGGLPGAGGGVCGPAFLQDCVISRNMAYGNGGGVSGATLDQCEVFGNRIAPGARGVPARGAGVYESWVSNSTLRDNSGMEFDDALTYGGGAARAFLTLTLVYDNEAQFGAGTSNSFLDRCTVYSNRAGSSCGGLFFDFQGGATSSVVWNNKPQQIVDLVGVDVEYCDVQGSWPGLFNHSVTPMFWDPAARDFHLKPSSPCIDSGNPAYFDPDGSRCDLGALPYAAGYCGPPSSYCEASASSLDCEAVIGFEGSPSLTGSDDFVVTARGLRGNRNGLMVWGHAMGDKPFMGGSLCISGPLNRTPVQSTGGSPPPAEDCSGTLSFFFTQEYMNDQFLWHGRTVYAQFLYRDHSFPGDPHAVGTTPGLRVTICP
jgi:hypothetical protein